jgi:hypothetical protein
MGLLTAETPQYPRSLVTLLVQFSRPKRLAADFVRELVYRCAEFVSPTPDFIEALLAALLCPVPGRQLEVTLCIAANGRTYDVPRNGQTLPSRECAAENLRKRG